MHVVVPTEDMIQLLVKLKPLKSITTTGSDFAVYTFEAYDNKLKLIISDVQTLSASSEIFANVINPGKISVNGGDFFQLISKIVPETRSRVAGSKEITLKVVGSKLDVTTTTFYAAANAPVNQQRSFDLLKSHLTIRDSRTLSDIRTTFSASYIPDILKVLGRMVASYTSDIMGISGVLLRVTSGVLKFVVSDGKRILEVEYPETVDVKDFDLILPKTTTIILHSLIREGDKIELAFDGQREVRFNIDSQGLSTLIVSGIIMAHFPQYENIFASSKNSIVINTHLLLDNISNVRKILWHSINDETYRIRVSYKAKGLTIKNYGSNTHVNFTNSALPVIDSSGKSFEFLINALLLESLLAAIGSESIKMTIPEGKPIVIENIDSDLKIRGAIGLALED